MGKLGHIYFRQDILPCRGDRLGFPPTLNPCVPGTNRHHTRQNGYRQNKHRKKRIMHTMKNEIDCAIADHHAPLARRVRADGRHLNQIAVADCRVILVTLTHPARVGCGGASHRFSPSLSSASTARPRRYWSNDKSGPCCQYSAGNDAGRRLQLARYPRCPGPIFCRRWSRPRRTHGMAVRSDSAQSISFSWYYVYRAHGVFVDNHSGV